MTTRKVVQFNNPADQFANRPGHWTMAHAYPHKCVHCGQDYNRHNPWPELPCPPAATAAEAEARAATSATAIFRDLALLDQFRIEELPDHRPPRYIVEALAAHPSDTTRVASLCVARCYTRELAVMIVTALVNLQEAQRREAGGGL